MPYEHAISFGRKDWRIEALEARHAVQVTCQSCGRQSLVAPHVLHSRHKPAIALAVVKLRCTSCGSRDVRWLVLVARPPRDAREY